MSQESSKPVLNEIIYKLTGPCFNQFSFPHVQLIRFIWPFTSCFCSGKMQYFTVLEDLFKRSNIVFSSLGVGKSLVKQGSSFHQECQACTAVLYTVHTVQSVCRCCMPEFFLEVLQTRVFRCPKQPLALAAFFRGTLVCHC